ncbi:glycosyltransferase family 4 protein [Niallia taxi]|uniref:glycosyltransferase family 4 protein n=1 Tax=Niallia taxi TaxID=2499688 RepID=UPI003981CF30
MKEYNIAIVGQIAQWKGQDVFIKAAKILHDKFPYIKFLIIGDVLFEKKSEIDYKKELLSLSAGYNNIQFLGHQENIMELLTDIDILIHASVREEPFGRVIIEGMASKIPVVATNIGGPLEIIENGISGILYDPGDAITLAEIIVRLIGDKAYYEAISRGGYERFLKDFHIRKTVGNVEETIEMVFTNE